MFNVRLMFETLITSIYIGVENLYVEILMYSNAIS